MDVKSVGQNIKEIREKKKITQKRLAELSGRGESAMFDGRMCTMCALKRGLR